MAEPLDPKNIDKRTAARYLVPGRGGREGLGPLPQVLPDVSEKAAQVETVMADTDDFLDDDIDED